MKNTRNTTNKRKNAPLANIILIQAAILAHTGIRVPHGELFRLLIEEGLITQGMITFLEVPDLNKYGSSYIAPERHKFEGIIPTDTYLRKHT